MFNELLFLKCPDYLNFEHKLVIISVSMSIARCSVANEVDAYRTVEVNQRTDRQNKTCTKHKNGKVFALFFGPCLLAVVVCFIAMTKRYCFSFVQLNGRQ